MSSLVKKRHTPIAPGWADATILSTPGDRRIGETYPSTSVDSTGRGSSDESRAERSTRAAAGETDAAWTRRLGTFALTGVAILVFSLLASRLARLPRGLTYLGVVAAALLLWVYVGRLVLLDPKSAGVLPFAVVLGFAVNPAWYAWLGTTLLRSR